MAADTHIHEQLLSRLRASESVEDVVMAAGAGFEHLFEHIRKQEQQIEALQERLRDLRGSLSTSADGGMF